MTTRTLRNIVLSFCTSILLILAWPPSQWNFILFFAFVPILIVIFDQRKTRHAYLYLYFAIQFFLIEMHLSLFNEGKQTIPLIVGFIVVPFFWSFAFMISHKIFHKFGLVPAMIVLPFWFVSQEVAQYYWDLAMTLYHLGLGLANSPRLMGVYPYFGQEGGTFLILCGNLSIYYIYSCFVRNELSKIKFVPLLLVVFILVTPSLFEPGKIIGEEVKIAIFQPSTSKNKKVKDDLKGQVTLLENALIEKKFTKADLLICPESYLFDMKKHPLIVNDLEGHPAIKRLKQISAYHKTPIFSGAILVKTYKAAVPPTASAKWRSKHEDYFDIYNGSIFITPDGEVSWRTKQALLPFAEITPFYKFFNFLEEKGLWPARYDQTYASEAFIGPYRYGNLKIAPAICFESLFPHVMANYINEEANLQVVISTDWTKSERLKQQQVDGMNVLVKSFGRPLVFVDLNQNSYVLDSDGASKFSKNKFDVKSLNTSIMPSKYLITGKYPWIWLICTFIVTFVMLLTGIYSKK